MKRLLAALAVGLVVATSAAYARTTAQTQTLPTKKPGTLIVGFDLPAPGFISGRATGSTVRNPRGFEVDLARAIARRLRITRIQWLRTPFSSLFAPGRKRFDFALEQITITAERRRVVDFSAPYFNANQGVLVARGVTPPRRLADVRRLQTCAQTQTTGLSYIQRRLRPQRRPLIYQTTAAAFQAVAIRRCDALVLDVPIVASEKKRRPAAYGPVAGQIVTREQYGALFEKRSRLRPFVSRAIIALRRNGAIGRFQKKWFGLNFARVRVLR